MYIRIMINDIEIMSSSSHPWGLVSVTFYPATSLADVIYGCKYLSRDLESELLIIGSYFIMKSVAASLPDDEVMII